MRPPPRWVRRVLFGPATIALTLVMVATAPVWLIVAAAASPLIAGRLRPLRVLWMSLLHLVFESALLLAMFGLWLAAGFGYARHAPWYQRAHYALVRWYLRAMFAEARRVLRLRIEVDGPAPDAYPGQPLIVLCRHAGPGDSFILTHALIDWYRREPRIVLKDTLQWDPAIDVVLNRLPATFVSGGGPRVEADIARLATGLDENDALVIFPEGGNFTPERRQRAIDRLRRLGLERMARRAEGMLHVLAPRPGGVVAALAAAPEADVLLVAHTGLEHMAGVADVWRELPTDKTITMRWWQVPAADVPRDPDAQVEWLYDWWSRIDAWIAERAPVPPAGRRTPKWVA